MRAAQDLEFAHAPLYTTWQQDGKDAARTGISEKNRAKLLKKKWLKDQPSFLAGPIASGPIVGAAQQFADWLKTVNRNYLALEMEGGSMLAAIYGGADPARSLVLRGISDFGDERKKELDAIGRGGLRRFAMNNATRLLWALMEADVLPRSQETENP